MTESELVEPIKLEAETLCPLPFRAPIKGEENRVDQVRKSPSKYARRHCQLPRGLPPATGDKQWLSDTFAREAGELGSRSLRFPGLVDPTGPDCDDVRVLVVESEPIVSILLRLVLENRGYSVREVESRAEAVTESRIWAPEVIVSDLPPTHTASVQFVAEPASEVASCAIIVIGTGPGMPHVLDFDAFFVRPFEAEESSKQLLAWSAR